LLLLLLPLITMKMSDACAQDRQKLPYDYYSFLRQHFLYIKINVSCRKCYTRQASIIIIIIICSIPTCACPETKSDVNQKWRRRRQEEEDGILTISPRPTMPPTTTTTSPLLPKAKTLKKKTRKKNWNE
jgi:hypothetical protein